MKYLLSFLLIAYLIFCTSAINIVNPLYDEDYDTAPKAGAYLDLSSSSFILSGGNEYAQFDTAPPVDIDQIPSQQFIPVTNVFDSVNKIVYYKTGNDVNGYVYFVNQTHDYQILFTPGGVFCFSVANYSYSKNIEEFRFIRRVGSVRLPVFSKTNELRDQIDDLYGRRNRICQKKPDDDIFDHWVGIMNDGSAPGGFSQVGKGGVVLNAFTSRYALHCYNKTIIFIETIEQFFPQSPQRNQFQGRYQFRTLSAAPLPISYQSQVDLYCQTAIPYSVFYNSECPFPDQPNVSCGGSFVKEEAQKYLSKEEYSVLKSYFRK